MPLYEYQCAACANRFEELMSASAAEAPACPVCGKPGAVRILSPVCGQTSDKGAATPFAPGPFPTGCTPGGFS